MGRPQCLSDGYRFVVQSTIGVQATLPEWAALPTFCVSGVAVSSTVTTDTRLERVRTALAEAEGQKVELDTAAMRPEAMRALYAMNTTHATLFPDRVTLCATKLPDDLRNLVAARVAEHQKREAELADTFRKGGLEVYAPNVAAFREHAHKVYLASDEAKQWPAGMLDKIVALK